MKQLCALLILLTFVSCDKSTDVPTSIVGTWDWSADAFKNGTITIDKESPLSGNFYLYSVKYDFGGTYDAQGAHVNIMVNNRTVFGATVSGDKKSMNGTYSEMAASFPNSYPFTATKR